MIQYQILRTNITRTVWETVKRNTNEILGVKRVKEERTKRLFEFPLGCGNQSSLSCPTSLEKKKNSFPVLHLPSPSLSLSYTKPEISSFDVSTLEASDSTQNYRT